MFKTTYTSRYSRSSCFFAVFRIFVSGFMCFISLNSFADTVAQQNSERADGLDDFSSLSAEKIVSELNDIIHKLCII